MRALLNYHLQEWCLKAPYTTRHGVIGWRDPNETFSGYSSISSITNPEKLVFLFPLYLVHISNNNNNNKKHVLGKVKTYFSFVKVSLHILSISRSVQIIWYSPRELIHTLKKPVEPNGIWLPKRDMSNTDVNKLHLSSRCSLLSCS